jgi:hypothetical protein
MNALSVEPNAGTLSIVQRLIDAKCDLVSSTSCEYNAPERSQSAFHCLIWSADVYEHPDGVPMMTLVLTKLIKRLAIYTDVNVHGPIASALQIAADPLSRVIRRGPLSPDVIQALVAAGADPFWNDRPWLHPSYSPSATRRDDDADDAFGGWYTNDGDGHGWLPRVGDDVDVWVRHSSGGSEGWQYARILDERFLQPLLSQRVDDDNVATKIAATRAAVTAATQQTTEDGDNEIEAGPTRTTRDDEVAEATKALATLNINNSTIVNEKISPTTAAAAAAAAASPLSLTTMSNGSVRQYLVHYHWRSTRDREWLRWTPATFAPASTQYPRAEPFTDKGGACIYARLKLYAPDSPFIAAIDRGLVECRERRATIANHIMEVAPTLIVSVANIITAFI